MLPVPVWLRGNPSEIKNGETIASLWMSVHKKLPQDWMIHNPNLLIPNHGYLIDIIWKNKTEFKNKVPKWMYPINKEQRDKMGYTFAMRWLKEFGTEPPSQVRHDPRLKSCGGETLAGLWIQTHNENEEVPEWMRYSGPIVNRSVNLQHIWQSRYGTPRPKWMDDDSAKDKSTDGYMSNYWTYDMNVR